MAIFIIVTFTLIVFILLAGSQLAGELDALKKRVENLSETAERLDSIVSILTDKELSSNSEGFDGAY